jgi:hypothetical protein
VQLSHDCAAPSRGASATAASAAASSHVQPSNRDIARFTSHFPKRRRLAAPLAINNDRAPGRRFGLARTCRTQGPFVPPRSFALHGRPADRSSAYRRICQINR